MSSFDTTAHSCVWTAGVRRREFELRTGTMSSPAAVTETAFTSGQVIKERWQVVDKSGEGGFGAVYKVRDVKTQEECAMKVESKKEQDSMVKVEVSLCFALGWVGWVVSVPPT